MNDNHMENSHSKSSKRKQVAPSEAREDAVPDTSVPRQGLALQRLATSDWFVGPNSCMYCQKNKPKIELVNAKEELKTSETKEVTTGFYC